MSAAASQLSSATIVSRVNDALATRAHEAHRISIAGAAIEMTVDAEIATQLFTPFAHLIATNAEAPALQVFAASLADDLPELEQVPESGLVHADGDSILHLQRESAIGFDRASHRVHAMIRNASGSGIASWHRAKPLQVPLSIFFADRGVDFVHGGLVSWQGSGVLIAGAGGSGKSTVSVAALLDGFEFLGDDCVAIDGVRGFSVFGSSCIERDHLRRFPLGQAIDDDGRADGGKDVLPLSRWFAGRLVASTTIRAILLPRVTHGDAVTIERVAARDALLALAPSSILKRAVPPAEAFARIAGLVRRVPAFRLEMGPVGEIGGRLRALLTMLNEERA